MQSTFQLALWAFLPPLAVLVCYYRPLRAALSFPRVLLLFGLGNITGIAALGLEWGFENLAQKVVNFEALTQPFLGAVLRQFLEVAPIEEGAKLVAVLWATGYFGRRNWIVPVQPSTTFLATTAISLGFAAEENLVYLWNGTASIFARLVGTPLHAFFSIPWGYALGVPMYQNLGIFRQEWRQRLLKAWLNSVACHAIVNTLSSAWRYPVPERWLSYALFPFILWLLWRMDYYWQLAQGRSPLKLISGPSQVEKFWQRGLAVFALALGGNAILGLFLLGNEISALNAALVLGDADVKFWRFLLTRLGLNLIPGAIACGIYYYLRKSAVRKYFANRR